MTFDAFVAVSLVMLLGAATPGPNNVLAMQAGARGRRDAARVIAGVVLGTNALVAAAWFAADAMFAVLPRLRGVLGIAGAAYLAWLGIAIARRSSRAGAAPGRASSIAGIAALQVVNPKAWLIAIAITTAPATRSAATFGELIAICTVIPAACLAGWAVAGGALDRMLAARRRWLELATGGLLVASSLALLGEVAR